MTKSLNDDTALDPVEKDHEAVLAGLNSFDWQEQLRIARLKREKVLAERALVAAESDAADEHKVEPPQPGVVPNFAAGLTVAQVADVKARKGFSERAAPASVRQRMLLVLAIGMAVGVVIGLVLPHIAHIVGLDLAAQQGSDQPDAAPALAQIDAPKLAAVSVPPPYIAAPQLVTTSSDTTPPLSRPIGPDMESGAASGAGNLPIVASDDPLLSTEPRNLSTEPMKNNVDLIQLDTPPNGMAAGGYVQQMPTFDATHAADLPPPATSDATPIVSDTVYIPNAASYHLNLHLAQAASEDKVRVQLGQLGLVNTRVAPSKFAMGQTQVAYYQAKDAQIADMLASLYGGQTLDMTGFTPAPDAGTLDIYLKD